MLHSALFRCRPGRLQAVLGQAHAPWRRLLGTSLAAFGVLALPAVSGADPSRSAVTLRAENAALASRSRAAALSLYALDSRLAAARTRLGALQLQAGKLRAERRTLAQELRVAQVGARVSQARLASRLRVLFDHSDTSALEVIFGARSHDEALVLLDNLDRFASINEAGLIELLSATARIGHTSQALAAREARLAAATRAQVATSRALAAARAERVSYIAGLRQRLALNEAQIGTIEAQVRSARQRPEQLTVARTTTKSAPATATVLVAPLPRGRTMTVDAVAYSLRGST